MKTALVLGAGGFIGGAMCIELKKQGYWVRGVDLKRHDFHNLDSIVDEFILGDLRDKNFVTNIMFAPKQHSLADREDSFDEVYQFAADMGGAGFVFTGENDADIMHNSAMINLNVAQQAVKMSVKKVFYSSSACMYPEHNQKDPLNPLCAEDSAYPANPDSEYGWEKLFSERLYLAFSKNYNLNVCIARYHNIFGPWGTWDGGREKAPAALCRKVAMATENESIEVWGPGRQTRSFLYIDECIEATLRLMRSKTFKGPVNIGSEEMVSINELTSLAIEASGKNLEIHNLQGDMFEMKYGFPCPVGVMGRNSDNNLIRRALRWDYSLPLKAGILKTYLWIEEQVKKKEKLQ